MGVGLEVGGVNHQPFVVRILDESFQQLLPPSLIPPAAETAVSVLPIPVIGRQIAPRCAGAQDPKHAIDETTVIAGNSTPCSLSSGQMRLKDFPGAVADIVPSVGGQCLHNQVFLLSLGRQEIPSFFSCMSSKSRDDAL